VEADENEGMDMNEGIHGDDGTSAIIAGVNDDDDFPNVTANIQVRIVSMLSCRMLIIKYRQSSVSVVID
jgi:hypothetical protein